MYINCKWLKFNLFSIYGFKDDHADINNELPKLNMVWAQTSFK